MGPKDLADTVAKLRQLRGPGSPDPMIAFMALDPRLSFASMSDCMAIGMAGGCGLTCPVLHEGRCDVAEDFREDALQVLAALRAPTPTLTEGGCNG